MKDIENAFDDPISIRWIHAIPVLAGDDEIAGIACTLAAYQWYAGVERLKQNQRIAVPQTQEDEGAGFMVVTTNVRVRNLAMQPDFR